MTSEELDAFLSEMEPEIRAADRDLREIDILEKRGILGAGKLAGVWSDRTEVNPIICLKALPRLRTPSSANRRARRSTC